ncbi:MAG: hypothetical protein COA49_06515 [Bacteroidetes bacterium]|nr:MAG: hypothetical protein COA49_06515 [Bacteroidota bacterium]
MVLVVYSLLARFAALLIRLFAILGHSKSSALLKMRAANNDIDFTYTGNDSESSPYAWFHCASLGEYEQAAPVIESYISRYPSTPILLTLFSPSGFLPLTTKSIPKWLRPQDKIAALPLDTPIAVSKFLKYPGLKLKFFATCKYEVWPVLQNKLSKAGIPSFVFAAHFTPESASLKSNFIGRFLLSSWRTFDKIFTQDESSSKLLKVHGIESISVGDPRADRVLRLAEEVDTKSFADLLLWKGSARVVLAGSSWPEEESALALCNWDNETKLIIAPHEVDEAHISSIVEKFYNDIPNGISKLSSGSPPQSSSVLIIDSIGLLSSLYALADLAVIGGGFGSGIHNVLEPVAFGVPVISGPNIARFREAHALKSIGALQVADSVYDLRDLLEELLLKNNSAHLKDIGSSAKSWLIEQKGAAEKITSYLP